jgi:hypothetical protein
MPILAIVNPAGKGPKKGMGKSGKTGTMLKMGMGREGGDSYDREDEAVGESSTGMQKEQAARLFFKAGQAGAFEKAAAALETFISCCSGDDEAAEDDTEEEI